MSLIPANINNILVESLDRMFPQEFARSHPFLDRMSKVKAGGSGYRIPVQTGAGGGAGGDFATSLGNANVGGATTEAFVPVPAVTFGHEIIDWTAEPYTETEQSPVSMSVLATKNALEKCSDNLASMLLGAGFGVLATIQTATNTSGSLWKLLLTVPADAAKFSEEDNLVSKATPSSASLDTGSGKVVGVNQIEGSILVDVGATGMTPTANHVIGLQGQLLAGTTPTGFQGAFAWCPPVSARTNGVVGDTFLGVVRDASSNVVFTSGYAYNGAGAPLANLIQQVCGVMATYKNAKPDTVYAHPMALPKLAIELDQKVRTDMKDSQGRAGFSGFEYVTAAGIVSVLGESAMPANQLMICKAANWVFASPKGKIVGPATNGKILIDSYDDNRSRCSVMANGFFGNRDLSSVAVITIQTPIVG